LTLAFWLVDMTFRSRGMWCRVQKSQKSGQKVDVLSPKYGETPKFWGICKSTPIPTYWPNLVEIPWLVFYICWQNKKRNKLQR